jgi:branched-subunit amino acid transport protein
VSLVPSLVVAVAITWLTRISFITLLPADRLPTSLRVGLEAAAPAVLGALVVVTLLHERVEVTWMPSRLVPLIVAAFLAHRRVNLGVVVLAAVVVATGLRWLGW